MKYATSILNWIKANPKLSLFIFIAALIGGTVFYVVKSKTKCEDCTPYQRIAEDLINAFSDNGTAFEPVQSSFQFAVYQDTSKPMTPKQWAIYRDSVVRINKKKLDSLLKKKQ